MNIYEGTTLLEVKYVFWTFIARIFNIIYKLIVYIC